MTPEQEYEKAHQMVLDRQDTHGDGHLVVLAALFAGDEASVKPVHRNYILKKLGMVHGPRPETLLDIFRLRTLIRALEDHANDPIGWIVEVSKGRWR